MRVAARIRQNRTDPMISFVNVVFLMVIFVALAGTVLALNQETVTLPRTQTLPYERLTPERVFLMVDGELTYAGEAVDLIGSPEIAERVAGADGTGAVELYLDRMMPATDVVALVSELRRAGVRRIDLVTLDEAERGAR